MYTYSRPYRSYRLIDGVVNALRMVIALGLAWLAVVAGEAGVWAGDAASSADLSADNVVVVLDASGSMSERMRGTDIRKMTAAKTALTEALRQLPDGTQVGVLVFSAAGGGEEWLYPLGPLNRAQILSAVALPEPGGGTPLGEYIKKAADRLLEQRKKQYGYGSYRLLIVTDGEASDPHLVDAYVPEAVGKGLRMDVIGVDMRAQHTLATKVHSYRRADDPETLKKAVAEVFAEVGGTSGADQTGAEAFAAIAPVPDQTALALLQALSVPSDDPLGVIPAKRSTSSVSTPVGVSAGGGVGASPYAPARQSLQMTVSSPEDHVNYVAYAAALIVGISVLRGILRGRKGE